MKGKGGKGKEIQNCIIGIGFCKIKKHTLNSSEVLTTFINCNNCILECGMLRIVCYLLNLLIMNLHSHFKGRSEIIIFDLIKKLKEEN